MNALQWIIREAKTLRRKGRNLKQWKEYVAQASAIYAKKHKGKSPVGKKRKRVSAVKFIERGESPRTKPKHVYRVNRTKSGTFKGTTAISGIGTHVLKAAIKERIKKTVDKAILNKFYAKTKKLKRHYQKQITSGKAELKKLI